MTAQQRDLRLTGLQRMQQYFEAAMAQPAGSRLGWLGDACSDDPGMLITLADMVACAETEHTGMAQRIGELAGELAAPVDRSGSLIGRYRLQSRIRWGGMAEVYRAVRDDGQFQQEVALKIARSDRKAITMDAWFEAERRLLARLRHPNICQIFDGGSSADGEPYFVMERIDGDPFLTASLQPGRPWDQIVRHALDLCSAVAYAHRQLIVHRDIKPENVLLADGERVKLLDFGIAATLQPGDDARMGDWTRWSSPGFAAPEVIAGEIGGTAADVYSLGRLFEALIERAPTHQQDDLRRICAHATEPVPEQRYESVDALARDLHCLRDGLPISLRRHERGHVLRRTLRRRALPLSIAAVLLLLAGSMLGREVQLRQLAQASALQAEIERDRARAVSAFLSNAYAAADPELNAGQDISVYHFLELQTDALIEDASMPAAVRADLLHTVGRAFLSLGRHSDADRALARALLDLEEVADGSQSHALLLARIQVAQAQVARQAGRNQDASKILQALLAQEPHWPEDAEHVDLRSNLFTSLAALEQSQRNLDVAERHIRRALALNPQRGDAEAVEIGRATQLVTLGSIQYVRNDLPAAMASFEEGLALIESHPRAQVERLSLYGWLGIVHDRLGRSERAEAMLRAALGAAVALYPAGHARISRAHGNLGSMLLVNGRLDEAEDELERAIEALEGLPDADPLVLAGHRSRLARVALLREDITRARGLVASHLQTFSDRYGPDQPQLVPGRIVLAGVELLAGRPAESLQQAEQAQVALDQAGQAGDPSWAQSRLLAARAQAALGRADHAQQLLDAALSKLAPQHADNPRVIGPLLEAKADVLADLNRHDEALAAYSRALETYSSSVDAAHPARGRCLLQMARLHSGPDVKTRAALLQQADSILRGSLVAGAPTLAVLDRLQTQPID